MLLLLDTHALLWWFAGDERLSPRARAAIGDSGNAVLVSAASAWEIATKRRLGKLPGADAFANDIPRHIANQGFEAIAITVSEAARAGALPGHHRDPFDRMLVAQALERGLVLVSNEALFDRYGVERLW